MPQNQEPRRRNGQRRSRRQRNDNASLRNWIIAVVAAIALVATVALVVRDSDVSAEEIKADYTEYDFGDVPIDGGMISTEFPIEAVDTTRIRTIQST